MSSFDFRLDLFILGGGRNTRTHARTHARSDVVQSFPLDPSAGFYNMSKTQFPAC
jgi:hypothetical protein